MLLLYKKISVKIEKETFKKKKNLHLKYFFCKPGYCSVENLSSDDDGDVYENKRWIEFLKIKETQKTLTVKISFHFFANIIEWRGSRSIWKRNANKRIIIFCLSLFLLHPQKNEINTIFFSFFSLKILWHNCKYVQTHNGEIIFVFSLQTKSNTIGR
jgi:hypothetical protein